MLDSSLAYDDAAHLKNYFEVNISEDRDEVKRLIKENGAVGASFYAYNSTAASTSAETYNSTTNSYYNPTARTSSPKQNHAVTIVGWNNSFSKNKFNNKPSGDGA